MRGAAPALLSALGEYPDAILVTGCQRSGTTILARIITGSDGMSSYAITDDDELDAALILSGRSSVPAKARYCFQTTYMYDHLDEYVRRIAEQKMIWVLRNPHSVIYSMLYNWKDFALNEVFMACGVRYLKEPYRTRLQRFGVIGVPRVLRACLSYRGRLDEVSYLRERLREPSMTVVDYDELVNDKQTILPVIYERIGLVYRAEYGEKLKMTSLGKSSGLKNGERKLVDEHCREVFEHARQLIDVGPG